MRKTDFNLFQGFDLENKVQKRIDPILIASIVLIVVALAAVGIPMGMLLSENVQLTMQMGGAAGKLQEEELLTKAEQVDELRSELALLSSYVGEMSAFEQAAATHSVMDDELLTTVTDVLEPEAVLQQMEYGSGGMKLTVLFFNTEVIAQKALELEKTGAFVTVSYTGYTCQPAEYDNTGMMIAPDTYSSELTLVVKGGEGA